MDIVLVLGSGRRPSSVPIAPVSGWAVAGPPLEVVLLAQLAPDICGSDLSGICIWNGSGHRSHLQPARDRGTAKRLQAGSGADIHSWAHLSSVSVLAAGARRWSRAPAVEVVRLRRCANRWRHDPC